MRQFAEIKEITEAEDIWMDNIQEVAWKILDNAFIQDCDIQGIKKYENMLEIMPDIAASLENRKQDVLMHINNKPPYTYRTLLKKLEVLYGNGNYDVSGNLGKYTIDVVIHSELCGQKKVLETMLGWFLPLNMVFTAKNEVLRHFKIYILEEMDIIKTSLGAQVNFWECDILNGTRLLDGSVFVDAKKRYSLVLGIKNGIKLHTNENIDADRVYINILSCFNVFENISRVNTAFWLGCSGLWCSGSGNVPGEYMPLKITLPVKASVVQDMAISSLASNSIKACIEEKTGIKTVSRASINFWQDSRQTPGGMCQGIHASTRYMAEAFIFETIGDVTITCRRNLYYIDGTEPLDGSRLVNAFYGKENI